MWGLEVAIDGVETFSFGAAAGGGRTHWVVYLLTKRQDPTVDGVEAIDLNVVGIKTVITLT